MTPARAIRLFLLSIILIGTVGCDQITKHLARLELGPAGSTQRGGRFLEFSLAENHGAFLSLGASLPQATRIALTVGVTFGLALLFWYLLCKPCLKWVSFLGLALIWAGGVSNLIDRVVRHGAVTDFMVIRVGPFHSGIFNLADCVIVAGILMIATTLGRQKQPAEVLHSEKGPSG